MSEQSASGEAVAERVRAANIAVGDSSSVEAMLANSLREGKPLADTGKLYDSIQAAENDASTFIFVPPGTFNESVTIDTAGLTLLGSGRATLIDGGTTNDAILLDATNITVKNLSVQTTAGVGNSYGGIETSVNSNSITVENVVVRDSDNYGIRANNGSDYIIKNCVVESADGRGIETSAPRTIVSSCIVKGGVAQHGIISQTGGDDMIVSNCIVNSVGNDGINLQEPDSIAIGNRVISSGDDGIVINNADCIVANNRISDSTNADINNSGAGTTLDANLTGPSN